MLRVKGAVSYYSTKSAKGLILEGFGGLNVAKQKIVKLLVA
jgi:hypothetical protein